MTAANHSACIVGIGATEFTKWGGIQDRSEFQLACEAILLAAQDAGLPVESLDGFCSYSNDANLAASLQVALGTPLLRYASMVWGGGGGGSCGALAHAAAAVESGQADYVVAFRGLCQGQSRRFGQFAPGRLHASFLDAFGLFAPPQMLAMQVRRHMHEYGTTQEQLGHVALICRDNANRNPRAVMHGRPLDMKTYLASRIIADPLKLYDCCLESDGACAAVITTRERARDLARKPVNILAAVHGSGPSWGSGPLGAHNMPPDSYASTNGRELARDLFGRAGVTPQDIDVAQIYDHFSGLVLMALEDYGFCGRGEGGPFVEAGNCAWQGGSLPLNTAGGNLSEAYIHGFNHVLEATRQIRGESTSQVTGAELCFVSGGLGVAPTSAAILGG